MSVLNLEELFKIVRSP